MATVRATTKRARVTWKRAGILLLIGFAVCMTVAFVVTKGQLNHERARVIDRVITVKTDSRTLYLIDETNTEVSSFDFDDETIVKIRRMR